MRMGEVEKIVGEEEEEVVVRGKKERRAMGKTSRSIKIAAVLLFSVASVAGELILVLIMTLYDKDDYEWIFAWQDKMSYFWFFF